MQRVNIWSRLVMVAALLAVLRLSAEVHAGVLVEVVLTTPLDEPRGYCLDVVGSQSRAMPSRGLQAHSCYSYQGRLGVDQSFDAERIAAGEFFLPAFNVCMEILTLREGAPLALSACDGNALQRFDVKSSGQIVPREAPSLCLTVADGRGTPGGGGRPVHLLRRLTLEVCGELLAARQTWRVRAYAD